MNKIIAIKINDNEILNLKEIDLNREGHVIY